MELCRYRLPDGRCSLDEIGDGRAMDDDEIAGLLGISVAAVRKLARRALAKLAKNGGEQPCLAES